MSENNDSSRSDRTRDATGDTTSWRSSANSPSRTPAESRTNNWKSSAEEASNESFTRPEWEELHSDPDIRADLEYEVAPWETIDTATDSRQVIFMPQNEELLKDDAFIVVDEGALCDLGKQY